MHRSLLKWWFILLPISRIQCGLIELWKSKNYGVNHRTMKMILDSCYENDSGANPTLIFGDFHESIAKSSVIWLNRSFHLNTKVEKEYSLNRTSYQPNKFILIVDSPEQLKKDLLLLARTRWWNPTALFFFIVNNDNTCVNCAITLGGLLQRKIFNSIFICTESGETRLFTFNPIANYAPSPWKRMEIVEYNFFSQPFNSEISCKNLHYDKTKVIHGYEIRFGVLTFWMDEFVAGTYDLEEIIPIASDHMPLRLLDCVVKSLNATGKVKFTYYDTDESGVKEYGTADMTGDTFTENSLCSSCLIIYPEWPELIAVIKKVPEISTLTKIRRLWAAPVLIAAAVAIGILFIVLKALSHDFSLAMLDLIRLLTYTSILMNIRSHKFRMYFATMLIFMVISNGVFQGRIAAFLTTQERENPPASLDELIELKYKIYSPRGQDCRNAYVCPKCDIKEVECLDQCIDVVLNNTRHACLIDKRLYETHFNLKPLDYVKISNTSQNPFFFTQLSFPLRHRIEKNIMRIFESGIMEMWINNLTYRQKTIRQEMEAEWSSPEYKPVKLYKLKFAFQVLALGLLISTIVYFLELLVAKYGKVCKVK